MCVLELELLIQMMNITSGWHELCSLTEKNILINVAMHGQFNEHVGKPGTLYM